MSLLGAVVRFVAKETAKPFLETVGEHIGDALGTVLGRKIDPDHGKEKPKVDAGDIGNTDEDPDV